MAGYFKILGAIPGFFISSLILWALWGPVSTKLSLPDIGYTTAMLITITLWLAVAPLATVGGGKTWK
jgi:hypothetical protein